MKKIFRGFWFLFSFLLLVSSNAYACVVPVRVLGWSDWVIVFLLGAFLVTVSSGEDSARDISRYVIWFMVLLGIYYTHIGYFFFGLDFIYGPIVGLFALTLLSKILLKTVDKDVYFKYLAGITAACIGVALLPLPSAYVAIGLILLFFYFEIRDHRKDTVKHIITYITAFGLLLSYYLTSSPGLSEKFKYAIGGIVLALSFFAVRRMKHYVKLTDKNQIIGLVFIPLILMLPIKMPPPFAMLGHLVCEHQLMNIGVAMEEYASDNNGRYPDKPKELVPKYIKEIPLCFPPMAGFKDNPRFDLYRKRANLGETPYAYKVDNKSGNYTYYCTSRNHEPFGIKMGYPQYGSIEGLKVRP